MHIFAKYGYDTLKTEARNLMTDRQTDRRTDGQTDRQTDRQTDGSKNNTSSKTLFLAEVISYFLKCGQYAKCENSGQFGGAW